MKKYEGMTGEAGMKELCSLDCFLLSGSTDIFRNPRKRGCWPSPGRAGSFTHCPGSAGLSGARDVQAVYEAEPSVASHFESVQDADTEGRLRLGRVLEQIHIRGFFLRRYSFDSFMPIVLVSGVLDWHEWGPRFNL